MDTRMRRAWSAPAVAALLGLGVLGAVFAGASDPLAAGPARDEPVGDPGFVVVGTVPADALVPAEDAAPVHADSALRVLGAKGMQQDPTIIEEEGFEGETFPPEGWELADEVSDTEGANIVNGWSRQICEVPTNGGDASAWSAGGGSQGNQLACGAAFTQPQASQLIHPHIDASSFPAGVQIQFSFWVDWRVQDETVSNGFFVCVRPAPTEQGICRYFTDTPVNPIPRKRWLTPSNPLVFTQLAGKPDAEMFFFFVDQTPDGTHSGVFVDNVVISGLSEAPTATPTPTEGAPTVTRTPTPQVTIGPSPTATLRPTEPASRIHLPILLKNADKDDPSMFPTPQSSSVTIEFGIAVSGDGTVVGKASQFQYGIMQLCSKQGWAGYAAGTLLRRQWYYWDGGAFAEIPGDGLNGTADAGEYDWVSQCAVFEPEGVRQPIPINRYKVAVFIGGATEPVASEVAEVVDGPIPGQPTYTPTWTPQPTIAPTVTPIATPGEGGVVCKQAFENGDFERGPSVGWTLQTNANQTDISRVIRRAPDVSPGFVAAGGEWLALLGGGVDVRDLIITPLWELPEASTIISATLDFSFGIITEEQKDGTHDDTMTFWFVNQDNQRIQIPRSGMSEEVIDPNQWYNLADPLDVSQFITQREGWSQARFLVESGNSAAASSIHLLDEIKLEICVNTGNPAPVQNLPRRGSARDGSPGGLAPTWVEPAQLTPTGRSFGELQIGRGAGLSIEAVPAGIQRR